MATKWRWMTSTCFVVLASYGCDNNSPDLIDDPYPTVHKYPSWHSEDVLVFESIGAVDSGPGWATIDPEFAGVYRLNVETGDYSMIIPAGRYPAASLHGILIAAVQGGKGQYLRTERENLQRSKKDKLGVRAINWP